MDIDVQELIIITIINDDLNNNNNEFNARFVFR